MSESLVWVILRTLLSFWWFIIFLPLFLLLQNSLLAWRQKRFENETNWVLLEIVIPREIKKSPLAMEQVLTAINSLRNSPTTPLEYYWDGEITRPFSLEMISLGGEVHFYVRVYSKLRDLVEAAFYSYYPDIELIEIDDYIDRFPINIKEMYQQGYDIWGTELLQAKDGCYPIKTYKHFESPDENKQFDPISNFLEVLAKAKKEELVGVQIIITPLESKWSDQFKDLVSKLKESSVGKGKKSSSPGYSTQIDFPGPGFPLPIFTAVKGGEKEESSFTSFVARTPGETNTLEAIEENMGKEAFETIIRVCYLSPKQIFFDSYARRGLMGAFNQYGTTDLNKFTLNPRVNTRALVWFFPYLFPDRRTEYRKQRLLYNFRNRETPPNTLMGKVMSSYLFNFNTASKPIILTTQCLATIFHPPTFVVLTAPHMKRIESRKAGPPAGLAIYGSEEDLEKFTPPQDIVVEDSENNSDLLEEDSNA
ncbi:MAG: hypothetical protein KGZ30_01710 [Anaplasmataceae bacterium]|nr:hypothetical protein [Anaplasmataceae bacterium]